MAIAKKQPAKTSSTSSAKSTKRSSVAWWKMVLFGMLILFTLILFTVVGYFLMKLPSRLIDNPRFTLRNIEVRNVAGTAGYWVKHQDKLAKEIGISADDKMKMFALETNELREKLLKVASVEDGKVHFVLPDTIVLEVQERIPRASLPELNPFVVADRNGKKMDVRKTIVGSAAKLPRIIGARGGEEKIRYALDLIMTVLNSYPDITIEQAFVNYKNYMIVLLKFRDQPRLYKVYFPTDGESFEYLLITLENAILEAGKNGDFRRTFDLRNRDQIVIRNE